ncbi:MULTISPECIES: hypothetical protein [unclassified Roseateles]|uniref:DUF6970 domain-containing protein n=1 Tax=unclassified Roseateles TaxID=2626991 RepID=UPI0006F2D242|nr:MULTISPECIES: hypothetical protein [unclassified Roseateles]KQW46182.1 hypothetical protein ASC81_07110 [Pelomonas sp. Root405]KRA73231.1 hypothetical protein ASD88_07110 [Pelomonas sp. Root662]
MPRLKLSAPVLWSAGIASALLVVLTLGAMVIHANGPVALTPLSFAKPDPAIRERIRAFETGAGGPADLLSFDGPDGRPVYLFTAPCCDHFNPLYDAEGRLICAPTGGIHGAGDGRCPAWVPEARSRKMRWPGRAGEQPWPPR